jgi:hypothetical protein
MILESIVTTVSTTGNVNIAPMGPVVDEQLTSFRLRPYRGSTTFSNLQATRRAAIHVTDDCRIYAQAVMHCLPSDYRTESIDSGRWFVLPNVCRYFLVEASDWHEDGLRADVPCRVISSTDLRPFFGFNRAKHAVIEAAILASRVHLLNGEQVQKELEHLQVWVDKTGGHAEHEAFLQLKTFIQRAFE